MSRKNVFGWPLYSIPEILGCAELNSLVVEACRRMLKAMGVSGCSEQAVIRALADPAAERSETELERDLREIIQDWITESAVRSALEVRARRIAIQVRPWLSGSSMLDIGCGDGVVASLLAGDGRAITLLDVQSYLDPRVTLPFIQYQEGAELPVHGTFDTSLLLTVLHHSADPLLLLREARRVTSGRCIIIESVFGVEDPVGHKEVELAALPISQQVMYATFVDWFYNRVIHTDVAVPYNFTRPSDWRSILHQVGFSVEHEVDLGMDQEVVPEHHVLMVVT